MPWEFPLGLLSWVWVCSLRAALAWWHLSCSCSNSPCSGEGGNFWIPPFAKVHTPAVGVMFLHVLGEYFVCSFGITGL